MVDTTKPVDRTGNAYCGPLVVAAILGTSTGAVSGMVASMRQEIKGAKLRDGTIKRVRNRTPWSIRGTYDAELFDILERNGLRLEPVDVGARYRPTRKAHAHTSLQVYISADGKRWIRPQPYTSIDADAWHPATILERRGRPLWVALHSSLNDGGTYVVNTPGHWAIVSDRKWCETHTSGQWVSFHSVPHSRRIVLNAWRVSTHG